MKYSQNDVKESILLLADRVNLRLGFQAMINNGLTIPELIKIISYELFLDDFSPIVCDANTFRCYRIVLECAKELRKTGEVKFEEKHMIFYPKLMALNPTSYGKMINSLGQEIEFYEHPTKGDEAEVLCVCHDLKIAAYSGFFETCDMEAEHGEYEPSFLGGKFLIGGTEN